MGIKADKHGKYRVNFYLNPENERDQVIINYLKARYSPNDYMKELLFSIATGNAISASYTAFNSIMNNQPSEPVETEQAEEYEEIKGADDIEL